MSTIFSRWISCNSLVSFILAAIAQASAVDQVQVNRTVPKVSPPKSELGFSAKPTTEEISRARVFEVALVPVGGEPSGEENAALAAALLGYAKRSGPDDFSSLTGFLEKYPRSPWRAALLTGLGFEYYTTAHYSLALDAWRKALENARDAKSIEGMLVMARATEELALLYARVGRMADLERLLKFTGGDVAPGASEKTRQAREALWLMHNRPEISFRCGPLALMSILSADERLFSVCGTNGPNEIANSASTTNGFSLSQVAELSKKAGLNYQMARREVSESVKSESVSSKLTNSLIRSFTDFIVPSVVHWKVGHYAAIVRQVGDRYLVQDPTFRNTVWVTKQALEEETTGYFLIPPGDLPPGWRSVDVNEGASVWGKGATLVSDEDVYCPDDLQTGGACSAGMPMSSVHLMLVNLNIHDTPLAYAPPVGPPVRFTFRYNSRDIYATERLFGGYYWNGNAGLGPSANYISPFTGMTHDWNSYLIDSPQSPLADVRCVIGGGGARTFTGFDTNSQTFAFQQFDQTLLTRTGTNSYEMTWPDGSKSIFSQPNGSSGANRRVYLTQITDPAGNGLTFTYDEDLRLVAVTDAIGQVTTLSYGAGGTGTNLPSSLLTRVTDPFGRFAAFDYERREQQVFVQVTPQGAQFMTITYYAMTNMTDMLGLSSQLDVNSLGGVPKMTTPYGVTSFSTGAGNGANGRFAETIFPDGSRERVEFNQENHPDINFIEPIAVQPVGMMTPGGGSLAFRSTYYWSRTACASSYGDYSKARIYHWVHKLNVTTATTSGTLGCVKEPLENRVYYNYPGQPNFDSEGASTRPTKIGRVLDDGQTQLFTQGYNGFGRLTNSIDPLGRTLSYFYASNSIDLLEIRQTRVANNELLFRATYNAQHRPLKVVNAAGQTNTYTYNARGQMLSATDAKGEMTSYAYDTNGYLIAVDGPLPGTNDTVSLTYDFFGRVRTMTGMTGYALMFDYDDMDRVTKITHPDSTFEGFTYDRLHIAKVRDRAGRETLLEFDDMRQMRKKTDPLGRVTLFDWCRCGQIKSLTDPLGRTTAWLTDVQGRPTAKQYPDGSQVTYQYENAISRLHLMMDEKHQVTQFAWNRDNSLRRVDYASATVPTPGVNFTYDPDYQRIESMTDGIGTTRYSYNPITGTPTLGAGALASVDGPLPNDTIAYSYDELGRAVHRAINGVDSAMTFDAAGRLIGVTNALGAFAYGYDGPSGRLVSKTAPNGQTTQRSYGNTIKDRLLQRITHTAGAIPISEFLYGHDAVKGRINTWSQQIDAQSPDLFTFGYDSVNQLISATVTNTGNLVKTFAYTYDPAGNRLAEQAGASNYTATYNGLNEIRNTTAPGATRTNEWDAKDRLVAVTVGIQRTEFTYDGASRMVAVRKLLNGSEVSRRQFVWCGGQICEERNAAGEVTKRFFPQGLKIEAGSVTGTFFYTRDHLGSIRELTDVNGNVRARYAYDPYGRRTKVTGDVDADFGFGGMFFSTEANLSHTQFRAYDPELGRWLSRDPLRSAETRQGPNLYTYVANEPINRVDPLGLCWGTSLCACFGSPAAAAACVQAGIIAGTKIAGRVARRGAAFLLAVRTGAQESCQRIREGAPTLEMAVPTIEAEPAVIEGSLPEAEAIIAEGEIGDRLMHLAADYRLNLVQLQNEIEAFEEAGTFSMRTWPPLMVNLDARFTEIVEDLAHILKLDPNEVTRIVARFVEFNPSTWPGAN